MSPWDRRFLDLAAHVAGWSKDPSTQAGAVVVDDQRRIVSTGYNGVPAGVEDRPEWLADRSIKYRVVIHAEKNALLFAQRDLHGCTLYVHPMPPCAQCAAAIIQSGIRRVVTRSPTPEQRERWGGDWDLAEVMYRDVGLTLIGVPDVALEEKGDGALIHCVNFQEASLARLESTILSAQRKRAGLSGD